MKKNFKLLVSFILTVVATIVFGTTIVNAENIASSVTIKSTSYHNPPMSYPCKKDYWWKICILYNIC